MWHKLQATRAQGRESRNAHSQGWFNYAGAWTILLAALLSAPALSTSAALQSPPHPPAFEIVEFQPNGFALISVLDYTTAGSAPGQFCACALKRVGPITSVIFMDVRRCNPDGSTPLLAGVRFRLNANTTAAFNNSLGGAWIGFLGAVTANISSGLPLKLVFGANLAPGTTEAELTAALSTLGCIATDNADSTGLPTGGNLVVWSLGADNQEPELDPIPSVVVHAGTTVMFTAAATDPDADQLTFSLGPGAPATAFIDPLTGGFWWTTTDADAELITDVTVVVTDDGTPPLIATQKFSVVVTSRPELGIQHSNNIVTLTWPSDPGETYQVLHAETLTGPWSGLGGGILATTTTTTWIDVFVPRITQGFYQLTVLTNGIPLTNFPAVCILLKGVVSGLGITAESIAPAAGETTLMNTFPMPFIVKGEDRDQLIQTCVCFSFGTICARSVPFDIMDSVNYSWTLTNTGGGVLRGDGPAVIYVPPDMMVGETNIATITAAIRDSRGNDTKATITYTHKLVREEACQYKRTVTIATNTIPGAKVPAAGACDCAPEGGLPWTAGPTLTADAPTEIVACAGERLVLFATGEDSDILNLKCVSTFCGSPTRAPVLLDEVNFTWSAERGTFPNYSGVPVSSGRRTSVIYLAPDTLGEDMVTIQVRDSGTQANDGMVEKKIRVKVIMLDLQVAGVSNAEEECLGRIVCLNQDDDNTNNVPDLNEAAVANENDLVPISLSLNPKEGSVTLRATAGGDKIKVWADTNKSQQVDLPANFAAGSLPTNLWVEGFRASGAFSDVELVLAADGTPCEDKIKLTVLGVDLEVEKPTLTLLVENKLTGRITPASLAASNYKFEIRRATNAAWHELLSGASTIYSGKAKVAGRFKVQVTATVQGIRCNSDEKDVETQFPDVNEILAGDGVRARMDTAWTATKAATTATMRREEGYYITVNTDTEAYGITAHSLGNVVANDVTAGWHTAAFPRPADSIANPTPLEKPTYTIAWFHTHTPTTHRLVGRPIGPSANDFGWSANAMINVPGYAYDYTESPAGSGNIPAGHPIDSAAQVYPITPPIRRPTP